MDAEKKVLQTMETAGKPLKGTEIADLAWLDKKDVDKAIKKLRADGVIHSPKACYYDVVK